MFAEHWHLRFLALAEHIAQWSKDPSTQTGGVIVRPDKTIVSVGYNGFPRGIADDPKLLESREEKYKRVVHSEMNAILNAKESLEDCVLYNWPGQSCHRCAVHVIQTGIKFVVSPLRSCDMADRWKGSWLDTEELFREASVNFIYR
jgi:dCMP deaminase